MKGRVRILQRFQSKIARGFERFRRLHDVVDDARSIVDVRVQIRIVHIAVDTENSATNLHTEPSRKCSILSLGCGLEKYERKKLLILQTEEKISLSFSSGLCPPSFTNEPY